MYSVYVYSFYKLLFRHNAWEIKHSRDFIDPSHSVSALTKVRNINMVYRYSYMCISCVYSCVWGRARATHILTRLIIKTSNKQLINRTRQFREQVLLTPAFKISCIQVYSVHESRLLRHKRYKDVKDIQIIKRAKYN